MLATEYISQALKKREFVIQRRRIQNKKLSIEGGGYHVS